MKILTDKTGEMQWAFYLLWTSRLSSVSGQQNCSASLDCQWHSPFCTSPPTSVSGKSPKYHAQAREKPHCSFRKCHFARARCCKFSCHRDSASKNTNLAQCSRLCSSLYNKSRATKARHCLSVIGAEKRLTRIKLAEMCVWLCVRVYLCVQRAGKSSWTKIYFC